MTLLSTTIVTLTTGAMGAVVGSFSATAVLRLASGESPWSGRSHCDGCARTLRWAETVPVAGYLFAGGRCATCNDRIDRLHLVGECAGAILAALALALDPTLTGVLTALLGLCLLAQGLIDAKTKTLPNWLNIAIACLCLLLAWMSGRLVVGLAAAVLAGALLLFVKYLLDRRHQRTMLGLGDIKLVCALSLLLGEWTPFMMSVAAILGLAVIVFRRDAKTEIPFGPMIALSGFGFALVSLHWGPMI